MHFGININNQGGNKLTFVITCWNPENLINWAPNSPSISANIEFMVRKYGKNMLRNISLKVSHRTEKRKCREIRDRGSGSALADHNTLAPPRRNCIQDTTCTTHAISEAPNSSEDTVCRCSPWKWICHWQYWKAQGTPCLRSSSLCATLRCRPGPDGDKFMGGKNSLHQYGRVGCDRWNNENHSEKGLQN